MDDERWDEDEAPEPGTATATDEPSFARCLPVAVLAILGTTWAAYRGFRMLQGDATPSLALPETAPWLLVGLEPGPAGTLATRAILGLCAVLGVAFLALWIARRAALRLAGVAGLVVSAAALLGWSLLPLAGGLGTIDPSVPGEHVRGHLGPPWGEPAATTPYALALAYGLTLLIAAVFAARHTRAEAS